MRDRPAAGHEPHKLIRWVRLPLALPILFAFAIPACDGIGQRPDLYAKLAPADQAKIDSIGPAVTAAVASALAGNLPGAVAEGVKAGANAIAVANSKDPDSDSPLGLKGVIDALMGGALGFFATLAHRGKPKKA